jgi:hypothetical protein
MWSSIVPPCRPSMCSWILPSAEPRNDPRRIKPSDCHWEVRVHSRFNEFDMSLLEFSAIQCILTCETKPRGSRAAQTDKFHSASSRDNRNLLLQLSDCTRRIANRTKSIRVNKQLQATYIPQYLQNTYHNTYHDTYR